MTNIPSEESRLDRIERIVEQNAKDIVEFRAEAKKWDERFFQLSRDNLNLSRTVITAGAAVIFLPFLQTVAPSITAFFDKLLGNS